MAQPGAHMLVSSSPPLELLPCLDERIRLTFLGLPEKTTTRPQLEVAKEGKGPSGIRIKSTHTRPPMSTSAAMVPVHTTR